MKIISIERFSHAGGGFPQVNKGGVRHTIESRRPAASLSNLLKTSTIVDRALWRRRVVAHRHTLYSLTMNVTDCDLRLLRGRVIYKPFRKSIEILS